MEPTEAEREALRLVWSRRHPGTGAPVPSQDEEAEMLAEIRRRTADLEQEAVGWGMAKLARPPRSGLWSRMAPWGIGWILLAILGAVALIVVITAISPP